jgi:glycosyltransferase involved in cell wall biosynthesis
MTSADGIDVVMLTKNSYKPYFRRVLRAIKREIPVYHFIVIDGYSTDGTVERRDHLGRQSRRLHEPETVD